MATHGKSKLLWVMWRNVSAITPDTVVKINNDQDEINAVRFKYKHRYFILLDSHELMVVFSSG